MPPDLKAMLRRLADQIEDEEEGERSQGLVARIEALEQRKPTADELREALAALSDEDLRELLRVPAVREEVREEIEEREDGPPPEDEEPTVRTRPGRKRGHAYMFTVDDEGRVKRTEIAHIYSGEDEPDEVELPAEPAAEENAA